MKTLANTITFLVSFVLVFQPAIEVVLARNAQDRSFQLLEPFRVSLASAQPTAVPLPSPLRLTRTQSAYSIDTAAGEIAISYHAVNVGTESVEDVLLVTTLAPGATLIESTPPAEVFGQTVAIVLPSVSVDEMQTATLRVGLPSGGAPLAIDDGASVFGSLHTREASGEIAPTVLPQSVGVDPALLAPTPDARADDTDTQRYVAEVGCDGGDIYRFVRDEIGYEAYRGSLRGSRGTLWSMAGNALDQASVLIAMLRSCGIPARYAVGTLGTARSQELIGSMFAEPLGIVGALDPSDVPGLDGFDIYGVLSDAVLNAPGADETSDPENDADLLETARRHAWVELWDGSGFVAADPTFTGANIGDTFTSADQTFSEIPDSMRHKVRFQLVEEEYPVDVFNGILAAAYYLDPSDELVRNGVKPVGDVFVQEVEVLNHTVPTVSLVGEPVSFGHIVEHERFFSTVEFIFNTYSPYMQVGRDTDLIRGKDYQEAMATIVLDLAKIVTGLFVRMTTVDPDGNETLYEHVYHDRFGLAQRVGEEPIGPPDLSGDPFVTEVNTIEISVPVSDVHQRVASLAIERSRAATFELSERFPTAATDDLSTYADDQIRDLQTLSREAVQEMNNFDLAALSVVWDRVMNGMAAYAGTRAYLSEPRLFVASTYVRERGTSLVFGQSTDLRKFDVEVIPYPGERMSTAFLARALSGQILTVQETASLFRQADPTASAFGAMDIILASAEQGIELRMIGDGNQLEVEDLSLSAEARARLRLALGSGKTVMVPTEMVTIDGDTTTAWLEIDMLTGDTIGVAEDGGHQAAIDYSVILRDVGLNMLSFLGSIASVLTVLAGLYLDLPGKAEQCNRNGGASCGVIGAKSLGLAVLGLMCTGVVGGVAAVFLGPIGWIGFFIVAVVCAIGLNLYGEALNDLANDPPLSARGIRSFGVGAASTDVASVSATARLPTGAGTVTGTAQADHMRVDGELDASTLAGPTDGPLALFPSALAGLGAGGANGVGLNFGSSIIATAVGGELNVDFDTGALSITGDALSGPGNVGFTGFDGAIDATDAGGTDAVIVDGTYDRVLFVELDQPTAAASHDSPASFQTTLHSNAADEYGVMGHAPAGWNVDVSDTGLVSFAPPFGVPAGSYEVRISAFSGDLGAEAVAMIDVDTTVSEGLGVALVQDEIYNVPQHGTLALTNYLLEVYNGGLVDDVFDVAISGPAAADFTLAASSITIPAGQTGFVGVALHPAAGLLPAGTQVSFTGTATGQGTGLSGNASADFTYPDVYGIVPAFEPQYAFGAPGDAIPVDLSLTGTGNGPSSFTLDVTNASGLGIAGIPSSTTVGAGATSVLPVTVTIPGGATPGTRAAINVVADLCNGIPVHTCTVPQPATRTIQLLVSVGAPEALCLFDTAQRTIDGADVDVARTIDLFGSALSELTLDPADIRLQARTLAAGNEVLLLLIAANLQASSTSLSDLLAEIASGESARVAAAVGSLCTTLAALPAEMESEADKFNYGFTLGFAPASAVVSPGDPAIYNLRIASIGTKTTPVELSLANLPAGLSGSLSQTSVTLTPGEIIDENSTSPITATMSSPTPITGAAFDVAGFVSSKPSITTSTTGLFAAVEGAIDVTVVTPNPTAVETAGDPLDVSVELLNRVNQARDVVVAWRIEDPTGALLFTGTPVAAHVGTGGGTTTVPLGTAATTGFADGNHNIIAQVTTPTGDSIPGRQGRGVFFVGLPFSAYATATPALVPPGSTEAVTSSVIVAPQSVTQIGTFADQFANAVVSSTGVTDDSEAVGPPQGDVAVLPLGAELIVDMGSGGERVGDGVGDDLVIFERDPTKCTDVHDFLYEVAVGDDPAGPFTVLGTASGDRALGDGFDLASAGLTFARYVRIISQEDELGIDAVLAAHTVSPNHIQIEHHTPLGVDSGVASTPVIGDIDEDGRPEIVFTTQTGSSQCEAVGIDGVTKTEDFRVTYAAGCNGGLGSCFCGNSSSAALGDIDDDGSPEVLLYQTVLNNRLLRGFDADGTEILSFVPFRNGSSINPVLENLDADPEPEVLWPGGYTELDGTTGLNQGVGGQPVAIDVDDDGQLELVMRINWGFIKAFETDGTEVWSADLAGLTSSFSRSAVADLDSDGGPDFVVGHSHDFGTQRKLTALDGTDGSVLWENSFDDAIGTCSNTGELCGGPHGPCVGGGFFNTCSTVGLSQQTTPTIADLDGDGEPEIATFVRRWFELEDHIVAFETDGTFMWSTEASDPGGTPPGVSSADLNGDGRAEVLWNGWCDGFTILDGATGAILYRDPRAASASGGDNPTAGDVDNDGHIEIATGGVDGMYIFGADLDWGPGRAVWNHLDYQVTNVEDDLTIPTSKPPHWLANNTYRSQTAVGFGGGSASVLVTHDLGASFSFDPGDITPAPSQVSGVVEWDAALSGLASFAVPGMVPPLAPGESVVVSDSSSVVGTLTLEGGQVINLSIPLGATTVAAPHIIDLTPEVQTASAGTTADFVVHLENLRASSETFSLSVVGFDPGDVSIAPSVIVGAGDSADIPLALSTAPTSPSGLMDFLVIATGDQGTSDQVWGSVDVSPNALLPAATGGVLVEVDPPIQGVGKGSRATVNVTLINTGSSTETFDLTAILPNATGTFADAALTVAPGLNAGRTTQLILDVAAGSSSGSVDYEVVATAQSNSALTGTTTATIDVPPYGVRVELSPDSASITPSVGTTLTATITNPGTGSAGIDLEFLGPLAPYACFDTASPCAATRRVSLIGGRTTTVPVIITNGLPNFPQQRTVLGVRATAENIINRIKVTDMDYTLIDILGERGVGLEVEPISITDDSLSPIPFHLRVSNTGNLCDERYTMTFASDPVGVVVTPETTSFLVPGGRTALVGAYAAAPAFGTYTIHVNVETEVANPLCPSAGSQSAAADLTLILDGTNVGPVANAGADQGADVGSSVSLDGTQSFDPDGGGLSYVWTFQSVPAGSPLTSADIVGANTAAPSFTPDVPGAYVLALDVSDGELNDGDTTTVTAVAAGISPIADAGPDQQVVTGDLVKHDGSGSVDPDGDLITFAWTVVAVPPGSSVIDASLSDPSDAKPTFTADVDGDYTFEVTVSDGTVTDTDTVFITAGPTNAAPVAAAGPDLGVLSGSTTVLDGRASLDPDAGPGPLSYLWAFLELPAGSSLTDADIVDRDQEMASFTPDVIGRFVIGLAVNDGDRTSTDETDVQAGANNVPPVADAGDDLVSVLGGIPTFDGSRSDDADNAPSPPTFSWRFVAIPPGSTLGNGDLRDAETEAPSFTPDASGTFVLRVTVFDGIDTDEDNVAVVVERRPGLFPEADVFLRRGSRAVNEGASAHILIRGDSARVLVRFAVADVVADLGGRELGSAHLEFTINGPAAQGWGNDEPLHVYRMDAPWTEGNGHHYRVRPLRRRTRGAGAGATWWCGTDTAIENRDRDCAGSDWYVKPLPRNNRKGLMNPWQSGPTDAVTITNGQTGTVALDVTADVEAFLSGVPNYGWALLKAPKTGGGTLWLDSKEGPAPPRLVITPR